jgi:hypothetical protein
LLIKNYDLNLYVDGANGVGAVKLQTLAKMIDSSLKIHIFNDSTQPGAQLNHNVSIWV